MAQAKFRIGITRDNLKQNGKPIFDESAFRVLDDPRIEMVTPGPPTGSRPIWPQRCLTSANVRPSHSPKSISSRPSSVPTDVPSASAIAVAVATARRSGELTTTGRSAASGASRAASACAWATPFAVSSGSIRPL